jgi:pyruvate formate lyase activating enzyme
VTNELILENLGLLSHTGKEIWVRIPVLPGYNDSVEFHTGAADLLATMGKGILRVDLLPFHNWCQDKYGWLGLDWSLKEIESMEPAFLEIPADIYRSKGFEATIGGSGFENREEALNL